MPKTRTRNIRASFAEEGEAVNDIPGASIREMGA